MPSVETVQAAVQSYPEAKGVLVTLPNYYGMGADLTPIAEVCHAAGMPLLVDEAHGAHYGQHPEPACLCTVVRSRRCRAVDT